MKIHRFYTPDVELQQNIWVHKPELLRQWLKVLRFRAGQELVLFDGVERDRLYRIIEVKPEEVNLELVTDFERKLPITDIYLFWSLLKKDKNDWVIQKCTELGVSHFVPLLANRSEKTGFNVDRASKIAIEAAEQCGRSDIPSLREPVRVEAALSQYSGKARLYVCEQGSENDVQHNDKDRHGPLGVLIGPEGGWTDQEKELFSQTGLNHLDLHDFTLRAETACVTAVNRLIAG